jgi:CRP/FNR family cyclic AMP-dependent transcriptional regulator
VDAEVTLFRQGAPGDRLFVVLDGALRVHVTDPTGAELELRTIEPGDFVGEVALLDGGPRSATVTSLSPAELFELSRPAFMQLLGASPGCLHQCSQICPGRCAPTTSERFSRSCDNASCGLTWSWPAIAR